MKMHQKNHSNNNKEDSRGVFQKAGYVKTLSLLTLTADFHRGRKRRGTAAARSPLLIAATLVNESISTGRCGASQQRLSD